MSLANNGAEDAMAVLHECFDSVDQTAAWQWQCAGANGIRMPISATFADGFLRLMTGPVATLDVPEAIDRAIKANANLDGGVKFAIDAERSGLSVCADIAVLDAPRLRARLGWALAGFDRAAGILDFGVAPPVADESVVPAASASGVVQLLQQISWDHSESQPEEWSVALDAGSAPPAKVRIDQGQIVAGVELARVRNSPATSHRALALFLLTACGGLRLVRAFTSELEAQTAFRLEVAMPPSPAPEEADHALAALSVAWQMCAREAAVLLDETAARLYLATCVPSFTHQPFNEKEN